MKLYPVASNNWSAWIPQVFGDVRLFAVASTAGNDTATLSKVNAYASMGFLQGGVELGSVGDVRAPGLRAYAAHGRNSGNVEFEAHRGVTKPYASLGPNPNEMMPAAAADSCGHGYPHILISFVYDREHTFFDEKLGYDPPDWLGDSGAFTAWTVGEKVELEELIPWCKWHVERKPSFVCISLDVIPGEPGGNKQPTKREQKNAITASLHNGDAMRAEGLKIMEVFHVFEPLSHLETLLERRQPGEIVGLGGMVRRSITLKQQFCDSVFSRIKEIHGGWHEIVPLHGLGLGIRSQISSRYPWWSLDSSDWITAAKFGMGVHRSGKMTGADKRVKNRDVRHIYLTRTLEGWLMRERALTEMWQRRGVTFSPDVVRSAENSVAA